MTLSYHYILRLAQVLVLAVFGLLLTACGEKDYQDIVPADARVIVRANGEQLAQLAGSMGLGSADSVARLLPGGGQGLNLVKGLYAFQTANGLYGLSLPVSDDDALLTALRNDRNVSALTETSQPARATWRGTWLVAWNSKALLILGPGMEGDRNRLLRTAQQLFRLDESMADGPLYALLGEEDDIACAARADCLPQPYGALTAWVLPPGFSANEVALASRWRLQSTPASLTMESTLTPLADDEATRHRFEQAAAQVRPLTARFAPQSDLAACEAHADGRELLAKLKKDKTLGAALMALAGDVDIEAMVAGIDGNMRLSLPTLGEDGSPVVHLQAECKRTDWAQQITTWQRRLKQKKGKSLTRDAQGYCLSTGSTRFFFALTGGELQAQIGGQNLMPAAPVKPMAGTGGVMHGELNLDWLPVLQKQSGVAAVLATLKHYVHSLRFDAPDASHSVLTVTFRSPDKKDPNAPAPSKR